MLTHGAQYFLYLSQSPHLYHGVSYHFMVNKSQISVFFLDFSTEPQVSTQFLLILNPHRHHKCNLSQISITHSFCNFLPGAHDRILKVITNSSLHLFLPQKVNQSIDSASFSHLNICDLSPLPNPTVCVLVKDLALHPIINSPVALLACGVAYLTLILHGAIMKCI